jgi:hypothetical protein
MHHFCRAVLFEVEVGVVVATAGRLSWVVPS